MMFLWVETSAPLKEVQKSVLEGARDPLANNPFNMSIDQRAGLAKGVWMSLSLGFFLVRKIHHRAASILWPTMAVLLLVGAPRTRVEATTVHLLESSPNGIVIELRTEDLSISSQFAPNGAMAHQILRIPGCVTNIVEGAPLLPVKAVNVGLPLQGPVSFSVLVDEFSDREGIRLAPGPRLVRDPEDRSSLYEEIFLPDQELYGRDALFPEKICRSDGAAFLRHQRVLPLEVSPVQWNPVSGTLRLHHRIVIEISYSAVRGPTSEPEVSPGPKDPFEPLYRSALVNAEQSRPWRGRPISAFKSGADDDPFATSDDWFRISLRESGICRLTGEQMSQAGLDLSQVDLTTFKMYHMGRKVLPRQVGNAPIMEQIPIQVSAGDDGRFDSDDEILFYATDLVGWEEMSQAGIAEFANPYTDRNIYWLTYGGGAGLRWQSRSGAPQSQSFIPAERFRTLEHLERDFLNLDFSGLTWYWDSMTDHYAQSEEHHFYLHDIQSPDCRFTIRVKGIYYRPSQTVPASIPHHLYVYLNDAADPMVERFWYGALVITAEEQITDLQEGDNVLKIVLPRVESQWDHILLDWFEFEYWRGYRVQDNRLDFTNPETTGNIQYDLEGFTQPTIRLLDISDPWNPMEITGGIVVDQDTAYTLRFQDAVGQGQTKSYHAAGVEVLVNPLSIERRIPEDLRGQRGDLLVIAPEIFQNSLEPLVQMHREEGLAVVVADIEDVYDQFSWGLVDATAVRDYLWYLYNSAEGQIPAYVLLFGDGNFDYKNNSGAGGNNWNPPFESGDLCTDDWFVRLDGDYLADMMIGRIPARSVEEADIMVGKIVDYVRDPLLGPWRNRVMVVSDDERAGGGTGNELFHTQDSEDLANHYIPPSYDQYKVYLMEYPMDWSNKKPQAQQAVIDGFNQGMLWINWIGHGNFDVWAHEDAFRGSNDIPKLSNELRLPLVYSASCDVGRFDHTLNESMSEEFLRARDKGAVAAIGATRSCFATPNAELNKEVLRLALSEEGLTLGQALFGAKLFRPSSYSNDQKYALFGDPCLRLGRPHQEGRLVHLTSDSLRALDHFHLEGELLSQGQIDTSFSGSVFLQVFDSARPTSYTTDAGATITYILPGASIFRGSSPMEQGIFEATFVVPKDISYGGHQARISSYATDDAGERDGLAYRDSLSVGGTVTAVSDTVGPSIHLTIAGQLFGSGDYAPANPVIQAQIEDESGINITAEVGHWIILLVDDGQQRINVTDHFQYDSGSYQTGRLEYTLQGLSPGMHRVTLKAWDNFNNFSTRSLEFEVSEEGKLALRNVLNCPNPFDPRWETTEFTFEISRPAEVTIKIYTMAGRLIRTLQEGERPGGYNLSRPWRGDDEDGDQIANGVYLYKIIARAEGRRAEAYGKVVVMR
jgi:hypothetical protein